MGAPGKASNLRKMLSKAIRIFSFDSVVEFDVEAVYIKMKASKTRQAMQQMVNKRVLYSLCFGLRVSSWGDVELVSEDIVVCTLEVQR